MVPERFSHKIATCIRPRPAGNFSVQEVHWAPPELLAFQLTQSGWMVPGRFFPRDHYLDSCPQLPFFLRTVNSERVLTKTF